MASDCDRISGTHTVETAEDADNFRQILSDIR
jgi:hypothetical protein